MQPPITHYKDEDPTQDLVNQEIEKEAAQKASEAAQAVNTPELKVLPVKKSDNKKQTSSNIVNAFRQKMSTNATPIELPSIGKTVEFREISTAEQKDMSKIAMESNSRSDIMYCAMVNLINKLSVDKSFDVRDYTEYERIAITLNIQQMSKLNPEIKFTCSNCGKENSYHLDTMKMLRDFNKAYRPDKVIEMEAGRRKFTFTVGWPNVRNVEDFFKHYYKKYDTASKSMKESIDNLSQIEYITMFVKNVKVEELNDSDDALIANLDELTYPERVQIMDCLPQNVVFDDETGVVSKTIEGYVTPMNDVFKYHDCAFCGAEQSGALANVSDFMGM